VPSLDQLMGRDTGSITKRRGTKANLLIRIDILLMPKLGKLKMALAVGVGNIAGVWEQSLNRRLREALGLRMKRDLGAKRSVIFSISPLFLLAALLLIKSDLLHLLETSLTENVFPLTP